MTRLETLAGLLFLAVILAGGDASLLTAQAPQPGPEISRESGRFRMLLDAAQLGGPEVAAGERTYPAGYDSGEHEHRSIELLYVLAGEFHHVVNGQNHVLEEGMLGFVRPGDRVSHRTGPEAGATVLMVWVPGEDGIQLNQRWLEAAREQGTHPSPVR